MTDNAFPMLAKLLERGEGKPDILARRSLLDGLIDDALSREEIRYLRERLNAMPMNKDILMDLPNELLLCIIPYLDLGDFLRARQVSRPWQERLSSTDASLLLIKKHFRGTWEKLLNAVESEAQKLSKVSPSKWLSEAAVRRLRRQQCKFRTWHRIPYAQEEPNQRITFHHRPEDVLYSNGRIAYRVTDRTIAVQTLLKEDAPCFFVDPDRERIEEWLLSENFLIAQKSSNKHMVGAWDLELNPVENVRLPSRIRYMSAYKDKVGLITHSKEIFVWHIGGALKQLDTTGLEEKMDGFDRWEISSILFHPTNQDTTFIVYQAYTGPESSNAIDVYTMRLIIQELAGERQKTIRHVDNVFKTNDLMETDIAARRSAILNPPDTLNLLGADAFGFSFGPFHIDIRIVVDADGLCGIWRTARHLSGTMVSGIRYDMFRNEFDTLPLNYNQPECVTRTIHGQAYDISMGGVELWADQELAKGYLGRTMEGDDDCVVGFGKRDYLVLIP